MSVEKASVMSRRATFIRTVSSFRSDTRGNIAMIFGILAVPLITFVGVAIDYSRTASARSSMQAALDTTALMVAKDVSAGKIAAGDVNTVAQSYFNAHYTNAQTTGVTVSAAYTPRDSNGTSTVVVNGAGAMPTSFMKVAGYNQLNFGTSSTTTWGGTRLRVAMALDVTGSMASDGKMPAMISAAKTLVDTLRSGAQSAEDLYISVIPFAQMVNVGKSNKNASWVKWDVWEEENGSCNSRWYSTKSSCEAAGKNWTVDGKGQWDGCVTDRDQPADTTKDSPTSDATRFPAVRYEQSGSNICPAQILPMTSAYTAAGAQTVKDKIDDLSPAGGTNQAIGMAWAWHALQTGDPLNTPAKDANYKYTDVIILLSDGLNTIDRWYGNGSSWSSQVDARQRLLCDNIKSPSNDRKTYVYTIQVNTDGDPESAVLKYCADSGAFFATTTASGIATAFAQIGAALSKLRVSR